MLVETYMSVACEINSAMVSLELLKEDAFGGIILALLLEERHSSSPCCPWCTVPRMVV